MTEQELQDAVIATAQVHGWWWWHVPDSRRTNPGLPDLILIKPPRVLFVELKTAKGRVRPEQDHVLGLLDQCHTIASGVVRPDDLEQIQRRLAAA